MVAELTAGVAELAAADPDAAAADPGIAAADPGVAIASAAVASRVEHEPVRQDGHHGRSAAACPPATQLDGASRGPGACLRR
jgi:hypothetical protein